MYVGVTYLSPIMTYKYNIQVINCASSVVYHPSVIQKYIFTYYHYLSPGLANICFFFIRVHMSRFLKSTWNENLCISRFIHYLWIISKDIQILSNFMDGCWGGGGA